LDQFEREILRYVIRYGMQPLYMRYREEKKKVDGKAVVEMVLDEKGPSVIEFVFFDLDRDHIFFHNKLYKNVFEEAYSHSDDETFMPDKYFSNHADLEISRLASDLLSDRYILSKIHAKSIGEEIDSKDSRLAEENMLETLVPRATTELKNAYVQQKIKSVKQAMKTAEGDRKNVFLQEFQQLQEVKKELAKVLGERIVLKY